MLTGGATNSVIPPQRGGRPRGAKRPVVGWGLPIDTRDRRGSPHPARFARRPPLRGGITSRLRRLRFLFGLALALWAAAPIALAQDDATPPAKDTIFARKIVMGTIDMNMDEVETMLAPGGKLDDAEAREHLDIISVLLMAFPHMFPACHQPVEGGRGSRRRARYLRRPRALDQLRRLLQACHCGIEDRVRGQSGQAGR